MALAKIGGKYFIDDLETGDLTEVTKETYEAIQDSRNRFAKNIFKDGKPVGTVMVIGTTTDLRSEGDMSKLWTK